MSQIILDDHIFELDVLAPIGRWITVQRLRHVRPNEIIKDDRVPVLLRQLDRPTFVTIDMRFWDKAFRDTRYCILCFPFRNDEQYRIPELLRALLRLPEFQTKSARLGKVARVSLTHVEYWQLGDETLHRLEWPETFKIIARPTITMREEAPVYGAISPASQQRLEENATKSECP